MTKFFFVCLAVDVGVGVGDVDVVGNAFSTVAIEVGGLRLAESRPLVGVQHAGVGV